METKVSLLVKTRQCSPFTLCTPEKFANATIDSHFGFVFISSGKLVKQITWQKVIVFESLLFQTVFDHTKTPSAGVFKSPLFEESFRKVPFSSWIGVDGRANRRTKAVFSNFVDLLSVEGA